MKNMKVTAVLAVLLILALFMGTVSADPYYQKVEEGQSAFVFEDIAVPDKNAASLTHYSDGSNPAPLNVIAGKDGKFQLTEEVVNGMYGAYYYSGTPKNSGSFILIWYPEITLKAELTAGIKWKASDNSIDGKSINKNTFVSFKIGSPKVAPARNCTAKLIFTTPSGGKTTRFGNGEFGMIQMDTAETITSSVAPDYYTEAGTWTVQAQYVTAPFNDFAKKSNIIAFDVRNTPLTLTAAKDSVIRSNPFTVTICGDSLAYYSICLENALSDDENPKLQPGQLGWQKDLDSDDDNCIGGAVFKTDASGKRTIQYNTAADTKDKIYTVKVNALKFYDPAAGAAVIDTSDYDIVKVKVKRGVVTIGTSGTSSYYIGDEIKFTGTNTDSSYVFLFITGSNLRENGIALKDLPTKTAAHLIANPVLVKTDDTWEYKWDTSKTDLNAGAYIVYAASVLTNGKASDKIQTTSTCGKLDANGSYWAVGLLDSEYAVVSINLKKRL